MPLILLIVLIVGILIIFKSVPILLPIAALIVGVVMGSIMLITLVSVWLGTSYSLRKRGYQPNQAQETYSRLTSDLRKISADLDEIRGHIADLTIMNHDRVSKTP